MFVAWISNINQIRFVLTIGISRINILGFYDLWVEHFTQILLANIENIFWFGEKENHFVKILLKYFWMEKPL